MMMCELPYIIKAIGLTVSFSRLSVTCHYRALSPGEEPNTAQSHKDLINSYHSTVITILLRHEKRGDKIGKKEGRER